MRLQAEDTVVIRADPLLREDPEGRHPLRELQVVRAM